MAASGFKAIIIGGGPVGVTAAHALHQAGIDFVLLEARDEVTNDVGASLVLGPATLRVYHQLGFLDDLLSIGTQLNLQKCFTQEGHNIKTSDPFSYIRRNHGLGPVAFHRAQLIQCMYDNLPDSAKAKVLTRRKVANIEVDDDSVRAICEDGKTFEGHVIIGADGVHSKTRRSMRKFALEEDPKADWDDEVPFPATYKCLWASFKRSSPPGVAYDTQHEGSSIMYITGTERSWIFLFKKLDEPTKERVDYTEKETLEFAESFYDWPLNEFQKVKDIFADRLTVGMANLEEGIAKKWHWGRIVLTGDACHKFTPNAGLGFRNGVQDVVMLVNQLREAISAAPSGLPTIAELNPRFDKYKEGRQKKLLQDSNTSALATRLQAWADWFHYIMSRFIMPLDFTEWLLLDFVASKGERTGLVFNFIKKTEPFIGRVSWLHPIPIDGASAKV